MSLMPGQHWFLLNYLCGVPSKALVWGNIQKPWVHLLSVGGNLWRYIGGLVLDAAQGLSVSLSTLQWAPGFD